MVLELPVSLCLCLLSLYILPMGLHSYSVFLNSLSFCFFFLVIEDALQLPISIFRIASDGEWESSLL